MCAALHSAVSTVCLFTAIKEWEGGGRGGGGRQRANSRSAYKEQSNSSQTMAKERESIKNTWIVISTFFQSTHTSLKRCGIIYIAEWLFYCILMYMTYILLYHTELIICLFKGNKDVACLKRPVMLSVAEWSHRNSGQAGGVCVNEKES